MSDRDDPLAPPAGYGAAGQRRSSGHPEEPAGDFSVCCTGCGNASVVVLTLGCTAGEHIGEFGYCAKHLHGPFWCGRCQRDKPQPSQFMKPMMIKARRFLNGQDAVVDAMMERIFDGKAP